MTNIADPARTTAAVPTDAKDTATSKAPAAEVPLPPSPPPQHPAMQPLAVPGAFNDSKEKPSDNKGPPPDDSGVNKGAGTSTSTNTSSGSGFLKRAFSKDNRRTAQRFFSAYAQTWIGLSPLWLMGEAVIPGTKVGTQFNKGRHSLVGVAEEVRKAVATSGKDVVVIVDEKLRGGGEGGRQMVERTAEVIKAAGENAILVVTTSLDKLSAHLSEPDKEKGKGKDSGTGASSSKLKALDLRELAHDPELKRAVQRHGRDALVLLDSALKHPVVVTGVSGFARSRGVPRADALLRLASLGLNRILKALPEDAQEELGGKVEAKIEEIDAEELERRSSVEEREEAESLGKTSGESPAPRVEGEAPKDGADPYQEMRKKNDCIIM